ncbi:hypothetical protein Syun_009573 [Stephania yunnanensis]|uniref:Uncharacterized protein n=1 Tax=Stephania yunnanensis TaxID=152371 RepID=A0AAP0KGN2_9MAGN
MDTTTEEVEITSNFIEVLNYYPRCKWESYQKKKKVSGDVYLRDQMVAAAQVMANEISKVKNAINTEHNMRNSFIASMGEVVELTDMEIAIYGSKIMGRVELMAAFLFLKPESQLVWLHAMFDWSILFSSEKTHDVVLVVFYGLSNEVCEGVVGGNLT